MTTPDKESLTDYERIIVHIFSERYDDALKDQYAAGSAFIEYTADDARASARAQNISLGNAYDIKYAFRNRPRDALPGVLRERSPMGKVWVIETIKKGRYALILRPVRVLNLVPSPNLPEIKVIDATPGIVKRYSSRDDQALLARMRYNRLLDIFSGITCFSLQCHWRTTVRRGGGQTETDELYVGVDRRGVQYVLPVQAKVPGEKVSLLQAETDYALCTDRYPALVCKPIAVQIVEYEDLERTLPIYDHVVLWEFTFQEGEAKVASERHYRLVPPQHMRDEDLATYKTLPIE